MYTIYIIQNSSSNKYYTGYTKNLAERLRRHNTGRNISTKSSSKWVLIHTEKFIDKTSAWKREQQIKKMKGGNSFKKLVQ